MIGQQMCLDEHRRDHSLVSPTILGPNSSVFLAIREWKAAERESQYLGKRFLRLYKDPLQVWRRNSIDIEKKIRQRNKMAFSSKILILLNLSRENSSLQMSLQSLNNGDRRSALGMVDQLTDLISSVRISSSSVAFGVQIESSSVADNMSRYKHFDDELSAADLNEAAVLPELDVDEPHQLEFKPQLRNYSSNLTSGANRLHLSYWTIYLSRRTRLERYLLSLIVVLLLLLFLSFLRYSTRHKEKKPEELCLTSSCIQVSSAIASGLNQTINPCDDFHEFVCGRWIKTNIIPKGHSSWSTSKELSRKNIIILKGILEQTVSTDSPAVFNAEQEAIKFYRSCMNTTEIERLALEPLESFLQTTLNFTLKQWIAIDQNQTWQELFVVLTKTFSTKFGFSYLLPMSIGPDDKNSTWNTLHVSVNRPDVCLSGNVTFPTE